MERNLLETEVHINLLTNILNVNLDNLNRLVGMILLFENKQFQINMKLQNLYPLSYNVVIDKVFVSIDSNHALNKKIYITDIYQKLFYLLVQQLIFHYKNEFLSRYFTVHLDIENPNDCVIMFAYERFKSENKDVSPQIIDEIQEIISNFCD